MTRPRRLPTSKSFVHEMALAAAVEETYGLTSVTCQLITASLRDVYFVASADAQHVLYLYRAGQRTLPEILAEWRFVSFLHAGGVPVAPAMPTRDGGWLLACEAPEGPRYGVLAPFVAGKHLRERPWLASVPTYGSLIARIHQLADALPGSLARPVLDWDLLVGRSSAALEAIVTVGRDQVDLVHSAADALRPRMAGLPRQAPFFGLVHGDAIRANAQVADDGRVTVLDFDLCGYGWRAYDVATYLFVVSGHPEQEQAFLEGYEAIRPLSAIERDMLPVLGAARAVFDIGVKAANVHHWGSAHLHAYLNQMLAQLQGYLERI
jgi:Ser/Thr protein kinase RdoA (MazF antagonist)